MPVSAMAGALQAPTGRVILTVSGKITNTNAGDRAEFDRDMLEALGDSELALETPWTDGRQVFNGVLGSKLLDVVGASGNTIAARAINDYQVSIPISDLRNYPVLFALKQNGKYMRVREKGPIWIIYPRETYPELDTDQITDRWVWQLSEIVIK
ncbi:MAG: oxidoreductase [Gammaproteobacteria bacterium]|nr:oxidoreductase [Gammaproteobacteria bacterium]MDH3449120.1 oxidoreductase [Gammaproteobacteria bacterium]